MGLVAGRESKWSYVVRGLVMVSLGAALASGCFSGGDRDDDEDDGGSGSGGTTSGAGGSGTLKACETIDDCTGGTVCDQALGRCVECLDDDDCTAGTCSAGVCVGGGAGGDNAGGAPGTGGTSSGSGGTQGDGGGSGNPVSCGENMIDDLEDDDSETCTGGVWFFWSLSGVDGTPAPVPLSPVRGDSEFGMRAMSDGYEGAVGFSFQGVVDMNEPVDVSAHTGIRFWAKAAASTSITVQIHCAATELTTYGGVCTQTYATDCTANGYPVVLGTTWIQYQIPFAALTGGIGSAAANAPFTATTATSVHFRAAAGFNFIVDDVEFYDD